MKRKGWIKFSRRELEWLGQETDACFRYYVSARVNVDWDEKHENFGTFDCRTEATKRALSLPWSNGKTNSVKNCLIRKGFFSKAKSFRLGVTNAELFYPRGKNRDLWAETYIQNAEINLLRTEGFVQQAESRKEEIRDMVARLSAKKKA